MPGITATGLGSGLDIESIVTGLMRIEQRPLNVLQQRQSDVNTKISSYGDLKSSLSKFRTAMTSLKSLSAFEIYSATSSDETVFTAKANSSAVPGSYSIDFSQAGHQLATADKENSTLVIANSTTSTFASGTMRIALTSDATQYFEINVNGSNDTLDGIRDAINNATDNIGVKATIINVDTGSRLVITADDTGTDSAFSITDTSGNVASTLNFATVGVGAQNAIFSIDGNTVTSQSNVVQDAIEGVDITLVAKGTSASSLTVANDSDAVKDNVQAFIDAYNEVVDKVKSLRTGNLSGENFLLSLDQQIRNIINTPPTGLTTSLAHLSEIGITTDSKGKFTLNTTKLESALSTKFDSISELLADDDQGYVYRLDSYISEVLNTDGLIQTRTDTLNDQVDNLDTDISNMEYRLTLIEARYRKQFSALDTMLSGLNATSNYLASSLSSLPTVSSK